jgi:hypothetical protein
VQITNNFPYVADITLNHTYDNSPAESHTWKQVMPSVTTGPDFTDTYNLGMTAWGHDTWQAEVDVLDGPHSGHYISDVAQCTQHSPDVGTVLTFSVTDTYFVTAATRNHFNANWVTKL